MKTIENILKTIKNESLPKFSWVFDSWMDADTQLDRIKVFPAMVVILPTSGSTEVRNGKVYDKENIAIAFIDLAKRDSTGEESAEIYNQMKLAGARYINSLVKSRMFEGLEGENIYETIYERGSSIYTGVLYTLQVKQAIGECIDG